MNCLSDHQLRAAMSTVSGWRRQRGQLTRLFEFKDFVDALKFVQRVGRAAERFQHHPDIDIRWNKVVLRWVTHDAGGLTARDFEMARRCNRLAG
ncbi:MAG: 4a-hydroxytetrahydrobiopterin dehydratase [Verrucomicrobia bacterium]|nr:4a-hydroxytetrahydrobiopterin dehydratase [Verrucomicrobiota bacterium]